MTAHTKKLLKLEAVIRDASRDACVPDFLKRESKSIQKISRNAEKPDFHNRITTRRAISKEAQHMARESVGPSSQHFRDAIKAKHAALRQQYISEQEQGRLERESLKDGLTGAFNRRFFDLEVQKTASLAERSATGYAIIMIDGDKFKSVNDNFGHQAGDAVLIEMVKRLQAQERTHDYICRYGGEEFAVILQDCSSLAAASVVAERMRRSLEDAPFILPDGRSLNFTASFGVAVCKSPLDETPADIIKRADLALYAAKGKDIEGLPLSDEDKANARNRVVSVNSAGKFVIYPRTKAEPETPAKLISGLDPSGTAPG